MRDHNISLDDAAAYNSELTKFHKALHEKVRHSRKEYVRFGDIHKNGIESVFSLFKRGVIGT